MPSMQYVGEWLWHADFRRCGVCRCIGRSMGWRYIIFSGQHSTGFIRIRCSRFISGNHSGRRRKRTLPYTWLRRHGNGQLRPSVDRRCYPSKQCFCIRRRNASDDNDVWRAQLVLLCRQSLYDLPKPNAYTQFNILSV